MSTKLEQVIQEGRNRKEKQRVPWWPSVRILGFHCFGPDSTPSQGTKILQAICLNKK